LIVGDDCVTGQETSRTWNLLLEVQFVWD